MIWTAAPEELLQRTGAERILVIKLSALGDMVLAFGPLAAIRAHHPDAVITLLTTPPFADLALRSPWVDAVMENGRPERTNAVAMLRLATQLRASRFHRVYDLQTSRRSSRYRWMVGQKAEWSGIAAGSSHPHLNPSRNAMHTVERQREQLEQAGIHNFPTPNLSWLSSDLSRLNLPDQFVLLIPGASPERPAKRWPHFPELAGTLPISVVVAGTASEVILAEAVRATRPDVLDLTGKTSLFELGALARKAALAVGNDTGPTHLAAAVGCPTIALFGKDSNPSLSAPRGLYAQVLQRGPLSELGVGEVLATIGTLPKSLSVFPCP